MKKNKILSVAAVLFLLFSISAQEPAGPDRMGNPENEGGKQEGPVKKADELFPYEEPPRSYINSKIYHVSFQRTDKIIELVKKSFLLDEKQRELYVKAGSERQNFDEEKIQSLRQELDQKISKSLFNGKTLTPAGTPLPCDRIAARRKVQDKVREKFPEDEKKMRAKLQKEAAKKYRKAKAGDKVVVHYQNGRSSRRIEGTYYGPGIAGKTIRINSRSISLQDINEKDLAMFSEKINARLRNEYVSAKIRAYNEKKFQYEKSLADKIFEEELNENQKNGFVYFQVFDPSKLPPALKTKMQQGKLTAQDKLTFSTYVWVTPKRIIDEVSAPMIKVTAQRIDHERNIVDKAIAEAKRLAEEKAAQMKQQEGNPENPAGPGNEPGAAPKE